MIIYNLNTLYNGKLSKDLAKNITENRLNDEKRMGDFLGYECPTNEGGAHTESLNIMMYGDQVHGEVCVGPFPEKVFDKINNYIKILKQYNIEVTYKIKKNILPETILENLEKPIKNIDFIKNNKNHILNYLYNINIKDDESAYDAIYGIAKYIREKSNWRELEKEFGFKLIKMLNKVGKAARKYGEYISFNITSPGFESIVNDMGIDFDLHQNNDSDSDDNESE